VPGSARTDTISGLPPGELFEVSVIAIDDAGNRSLPSRPVVGRPVKRRPPASVEIRRASFDRARGGVTIEWEAPAPDVVRLVVMRRRERDSTWVEIGAAQPGARRFEDPVPAPGGSGVRLEYTVKAVDRFGNAAQSRARRVSVPEEGR
jgi:hypothetical protein